MVQSTFTFLIANPTTGSSSSRKPAYIPASTASILISYIGDNPNATPAPGATAPASLPSSNTTTINVTLQSTNPPPAGQCVQVGSGLLCTAALTLPVGVIDMYIQAYSATNGGGTLFASSVTRIQVNSTGTLTAPGTSTAATPAPLAANISAPSAVVSPPASTLAVAAAAVIPLPTATASPIIIPANGAAFAGATNGQFVDSAGQLPTFYGPDGSQVAVGNSVSNVVVTDADTSGNTCLIYGAYKTSAATAQPCSFASSGTPATITLTNSGDQYVVQYAGKAVPGAGFNISFSITGSTATSTPKPQAVTITPNSGSFGAVSITVAKTQTGAIIYDSTSKKVYIGTTDGANPVLSVSYSTSTGYGSLAAASNTPTTVNGSALTSLTAGGAASLVIGPDNNIWFTEAASSSTSEYVGVLAVNAAIISATTGSSVSSGSTVYGQYALSAASAATPVAIGNAGGYIWFVDNLAQAWRINPLTGSVNPNLNTAYSPGATLALTNQGKPITQAGGTALAGVPTSNMVTIGSNLYVAAGAAGKNILKLTLDTSSAPSAGVCSTQGPPPCIAAQPASSGISGNTTANAILTLSTDGTNVYAVDGTTGLLYSMAPSTMTITQAVANTNTTAGFLTGGAELSGLGQGSDGYFWNLTATKTAAGIASLTSTKTQTGLATPAACLGTTAGAVGSNGFALGPDGTLLYAPNLNSNSSVNLCGLIY